MMVLETALAHPHTKISTPPPAPGESVIDGTVGIAESSKVLLKPSHEFRIEDYLHSDIMKPQGDALRQSITV